MERSTSGESKIPRLPDAVGKDSVRNPLSCMTNKEDVITISRSRFRKFAIITFLYGVFAGMLIGAGMVVFLQ